MSRLLQLPKELRLQIYEDVFDLELPSSTAMRDFLDKFVDGCSFKAGPIIIGGPPGRPWNCRPDPYHPTLLQVTSSIRREALPLFYQSRVVVLLLRYREGRVQVQHWVNMFRQNPVVAERVKHISIQYFEDPHRSTAVLFDRKGLEILNSSWLLHPLTNNSFILLDQLDSITATARAANGNNTTASVEVVSQIVNVMTRIVERSTLRHHSMANLRLHGYSDFSQRFEIIRLLYNSSVYALY